MSLVRGALLTLVALASRVETAEACACCDAKFQRTPIGWSADGAVLIDTFDTVACEHKRRLEVWKVDATKPSGCFDFYGDPEKEIPCGDLTPGTPRDTWKKKSAAAKKKFAKAPMKLPASKVRVTQKWMDSEEETDGNLAVKIDVKTKTGWQHAWSGIIQPTDQAMHDATTKVRLDVSVWPNASGDLALVLLGYVEFGTGNRHVDVNWARWAK